MSQKQENQLRLALETPESVRKQTEDLNVGFDGRDQTWEVIVKYHGSLGEAERMGAVVEELIAGYAIMKVPESLLAEITALEEIEYMEKPKRFYYDQVIPTEGSCVYPVTLQEPFLTGEGVLTAVLDSGIAFERREFRKDNGETRILYLWDQTLEAEDGQHPPEGFLTGVEFTESQINAVLESERSQESLGIVDQSFVLSRDISGHGTAVAGILGAAMSEEGMQKYIGVAPESDFLIVKLGIPEETSFPRTTEIMRGVTYVVRRALELQKPLVINLSIGNTYGSHDGTSLLERFLDNAAQIGRTVICVGSGNEGDSGGHVFGNVRERQVIEWTVGEYERSLSLQIWKNYNDIYQITLRSPGNENQIISEQIESGKYELQMEQTRILVYVGEPTPYSINQETYLEFLPLEGSSANNYINNGVWQIQIEPIQIVTGDYSLYLPSREARSTRTAFLRPTPQATFTIPSTATGSISVGAYDSTYRAYADFSGRGYEDTQVIARFAKGYGKPDIVAPGVNILAPSVYGGLIPVTGTSFATPIVAGAVALLMEWGIVRGNDPFLYGEKVKAYLIRGAKALPGFSEYPNAQVGWGALCVEDSLP